MASPFWKYFHDALHWPQVFHPGPLSAMAKGLALYMDGVREDILWLRRQWTPATADEELVERYGASRGIYRQRFDTDQSFRARVVNAYAWHHLGGKVRGLERIFAENGLAGTEILPASLPELWAHFRLSLDVTDMEFTADSAALSWWLANEYKPARSKLEYFLTKARAPLEVHGGVGLRSRTATLTNSLLFTEPAPVPLRERTALALSGITSCRNTAMHFIAPEPPRQRQHTGLRTGGLTESSLGLWFAPAKESPVRPLRCIRVDGGTASRVIPHFVPPCPPRSRRRLATGFASRTVSSVALVMGGKVAAWHLPLRQPAAFRPRGSALPRKHH